MVSAHWAALDSDVGIVTRLVVSGLVAIGPSCSLADKESMLMSGSVKRLLFVTVGMVISFSANAFELNGAWTSNAENCGKVFEAKNGKVSFTHNSDVFGSGFIVEGNRISGPAKACKITNRKEQGSVLHLIALCITDIAVLGSQEVSAKIDNDDQLTRIYPEFPEMGIPFFRCKL